MPDPGPSPLQSALLSALPSVVPDLHGGPDPGASGVPGAPGASGASGGPGTSAAGVGTSGLDVLTSAYRRAAALAGASLVLPAPAPAPVPPSDVEAPAPADVSAPAEAVASVAPPAPVVAPMAAPTAPVGVPDTPVSAPAPAPAPASALGRVPSRPGGLGTSGLFLSLREAPAAQAAPAAPAVPSAGAVELPGPAAAPSQAEGIPIPGLYFHPVPEPDPVRVAEVSRRIKEWAVHETEIYPPEWEDQFDGFSVGRYMVACHPDAPTVDHLMVATRLMVAENAVDDIYCEDHGGSPVGLGGRLLLAHTALDALHTTKEYGPAWLDSLQSDAPRRAYTSAMQYFARQATPSQTDRFRHDMARLHMGYLAEAAWAETDYVPEVYEYLAMRQFNNFRPCPTITDTVGGYELPADLHAQPGLQKVIALAGNATTIVNDLYSYTKELKSPGKHLNLPVVISERERLSDREGYLKAVEVHNELMHEFEAASAEFAAAVPLPTVQRFLRGVAVWLDGNHYWHMTNTYRYSLPDFW